MIKKGAVNIALIAGAALTAYHWDDLTVRLVDWIENKVDFKINKPTRFQIKMDGSLTFDFNFEYTNPTAASIQADSLEVQVYKQVAGGWELLAQNTRNEDFIMSQGRNEQTINMTLPAMDTASAIASSLTNLFTQGQRDKYRIDATIRFKAGIPPISYSYQFNPYTEILGGLAGIEQVDGLVSLFEDGYNRIKSQYFSAVDEVSDFKENINAFGNQSADQQTYTTNQEGGLNDTLTASFPKLLAIGLLVGSSVYLYHQKTSNP